MTAWQHVGCLVLALLAVGFVYAAHHAAGFVYEDHRWQDVYSAGQPQPDAILQTRALARWSWWLQARIAPSPLAFHAVNLALHLVASALVGALAWRLGCSAVASWMAAAVFLVNVTQVEAVAYASGRADILAAIGVLTAAVCLAGRWSLGAIAGALAAVAVGLAGKESAIVALALGPLVARRWRTALFGAAAMTMGVAWVAFRPGYSAPSGAWVLLQATAAYRSLVITVLPVGHTVDYDYAPVLLGVRIGSALALATVAAAAWAYRHRRPVAAIGGLWVIVCVLPRLVFQTPTSPLNDHQFYLATAGLALIAALFVDTGFQAPEVHSC